MTLSTLTAAMRDRAVVAGTKPGAGDSSKRGWVRGGPVHDVALPHGEDRGPVPGARRGARGADALPGAAGVHVLDPLRAEGSAVLVHGVERGPEVVQPGEVLQGAGDRRHAGVQGPCEDPRGVARPADVRVPRVRGAHEVVVL